MPILTIEEETILNEDDKCASRQIVRHVTVALKRYMESHLYLKAEQLKRAEHASGQKEPWTPSISPNKVNYQVKNNQNIKPKKVTIN